MAAFVREVTEFGNVGAMGRRVMGLGINNILKLAWWNKARVVKIINKDFGAGMVMLLQTELLNLPVGITRVAIVDQVVDMTVALDNVEMLCELVTAVRQAGYQTILMTNNLPQLLKLLRETKIRNVWFAFPNNKDGYEMNPSKEMVVSYAQLLEPSRVYQYELLA